MYCIKCGVKLADSEKSCPLCGTTVCHPDFPHDASESLYPTKKYPKTKAASKLPAIVLTVLFSLAAITTFLADFRINGSVTWCGFVLGALAMTSVMAVLPLWFSHPNPVIFVPCSFIAIGLYVLYINFVTGGGWFISFAFPVVGIVGLTVTAVVTLFRYLRRGGLYILGGAFTLLGVSMLPIEFLASYTFGIGRFIGWSLYPLAALVLLGGFLIFLAIYRPARETMERIFFI